MDCFVFLFSIKTFVTISDLTSFHKFISKIAMTGLSDQAWRLESFRSLVSTWSDIYVMILSNLLSSSVSLMFIVLLLIIYYIALTFEIRLWCLTNFSNHCLHSTIPSSSLVWSVLFKISVDSAIYFWRKEIILMSMNSQQ